MEKKIGFAIFKIVTEQFAIIEESYLSDKEVSLNTGLKFRADKEQLFISIQGTIKFQQEIGPFLICSASCFFNVDPESWNDFKADGTEEIEIPQGFMTHLSAITVGIIRGILHAKTEGTNFNGFVLPTLNVTEMINGNVKF